MAPFRRSPLAEFGVGARSSAGYPEGYCVGQAWHGRVAAGCRVALGSSRSSTGHTEAGIVVKIHLDFITTMLLYYIIRIVVRTKRGCLNVSNVRVYRIRTGTNSKNEKNE